jgi:MFS family permease
VTVAPEAIERRDESRHGWIIVAALGVAVTVSYGVLSYAFAVLVVPMQQDLGASRAAITGAASVGLLVSAAASIPVGRLLDRVSPRLVMAVGAVGASTLVFAWSRVETVAQLYLVWAALGVCMAAVLYEPVFIVVTKWFSSRRSAALTTVTLIGAWSSIVFSPLTEHLLSTNGWRGAAERLAVILAVTTIPLHLAARRPRHHGQSHRAADAGRRALLRSREWWLLAGALAAKSFVSGAIIVHLVPLLLDRGTGAAFAALAAGIMGLSQLPGRVAFAAVGRQLDAHDLTAVVYAAGATSLLILASSSSHVAVLAFAVVFGMSNGMSTLLRATLVADLHGATHYGAISGLYNAVALVAYAVAPFAGAMLLLLPGQATSLLVTLALVSVAAGIVVRTVRPAAEPSVQDLTMRGTVPRWG